MMSIGDFARLGGVSVRTVRFYDERGLLCPSSVDERTGYRAYDPSSLARLHRIVALKELGFSLAEIGELVDGLSADALRGMLTMKRHTLADEAARANHRLDTVRRHLAYLERETNMLTDVVIKTVPPTRVATVRCHPGTSGFDELLPLLQVAFQQLVGAIGATDARRTGPPLVFYEQTDDDLTAFAAVVVDRDVHDERVTMVTLDQVTVAAYVHTGSVGHDHVGPLYSALWVWAEAHGHQPQGPGRDILIDVTGTDHDVLEIQLPLRTQVDPS